MRKVFAYIAIIVLFFQVACLPLNFDLSKKGLSVNIASAVTDSAVTSGASTPAGQATTPVVQSAGTTNAAPGAKTDTSSSNYGDTAKKAPWSLTGWAMPPVLDIVMTVYAAFLHDMVIPAVGRILDYSVRFMNIMIALSVDSGVFRTDSAMGTGQAIEMGWILVRDFLNIVLIFTLLWMGFKMILSLKTDSALILKVVMVGLLINFSLFFTQIAVDISNIFTVNINNAIQRVVAQAGSAGVVDVLPTFNTGKVGAPVDNVGQNIAASLGLFRFYTEAMPATKSSAEKILPNANNLATAWIFIFLMAFAIYVFFRVGLLFLTRTIILSVLMVFSPVYFVGMVFPKLSKEKKQWEDLFFNQLIFGPIFLLVLYVIVKLIDSPAFMSYMRNQATASFSVVNFVGYFLIMGLLYAALKVANDYGKAGSDMVFDWAKKGIGSAVGVTAAAFSGGASLVARGAAARVLGDKALQAQSALKTPEGDAARRRLSSAELWSKKTFDLKDTTIGKNMNKLGIGSIPKEYSGVGGYVDLMKAKELKDEDIERAKKYGTFTKANSDSVVSSIPLAGNIASILTSLQGQKQQIEDAEKDKFKKMQKTQEDKEKTEKKEAQQGEAEAAKKKAVETVGNKAANLESNRKRAEEETEKVKDVDEHVKASIEEREQSIKNSKEYIALEKEVRRAEVEIKEAEAELGKTKDMIDALAKATEGRTRTASETKTMNDYLKALTDGQDKKNNANGRISQAVSDFRATNANFAGNIDSKGKIDTSSFAQDEKDKVAKSVHGVSSYRDLKQSQLDAQAKLRNDRNAAMAASGSTDVEKAAMRNVLNNREGVDDIVATIRRQK